MWKNSTETQKYVIHSSSFTPEPVSVLTVYNSRHESMHQLIREWIQDFEHGNIKNTGISLCFDNSLAGPKSSS